MTRPDTLWIAEFYPTGWSEANSKSNVAWGCPSNIYTHLLVQKKEGLHCSRAPIGPISLSCFSIVYVDQNCVDGIPIKDLTDILSQTQTEKLHEKMAAKQRFSK